VAAAGFAWLAVLNAAAARGLAPYAVHGRSVAVEITSCGIGHSGSRTCRGSYRVDGHEHTGEEVLGADTAKVGATVSARVDNRDPGTADTGGTVLALTEAAFLALASAVISVGCVRAAVRARRRRATAVPAPPPAPDPDDPLAWVRKRRFGAR
jgi:hypothetical protein